MAMTDQKLQKKQQNNIQKLITAFVVILALVAMVTFVNSRSVNRVTDKTNQLIVVEIPELRKVTSLQNQINIATNNLFEYYATLDRQYYLNNEPLTAKITTKLNDIRLLKSQKVVSNSLKTQLTAFQQYSVALDAEMSDKNRNWDNLREQLFAAQNAAKAMQDSLAAISHAIKNKVEQNSLVTQQEVKQLNHVQLGFSIAVLLAAGFMMFNLFYRVKDQSELFNRAYLNDVSQLPNRKLFEKNISETEDPDLIAKQSYLLLGLDRFNLVTGSLGYLIGDKLIEATSVWLETKLKVLGHDYKLFHFSGVEWLIILPNTTKIEEINHIANALLSLSTTPLQIGDRQLSVNCSIGMSFGAENGENIQELLRNLDAALRKARQAGGNCVSKYTKQMSIETQNWLDTEHALRYAVEKRELALFYQPKINAKTGKICSAEALLRWHKDGEFVSPAIFIPIAESSRLIIKIGHWVLLQACKEWMGWQSKGLPALPVAVNVSALQFQEPSFPDQVKAVIESTGMPPEMLELEITEEAAAFDPQHVVEIMQELKSIGVSLAIDDFGTGYSSLSHLKNFPVDVLKIDRSFVRDLDSATSTDASIVKLILKLAQQLHFKVVAEGVETEMQYQQLKHWGCDILQGFLFSKPLPEAEFEQVLKLEHHTQAEVSNGT